MGHASDLFGGGVPEDDLAVPVDRDDAVCDVGKDRNAALLLEGDARIELGVRKRCRRVPRKRKQRLDLFGPPPAGLARVDGQHARERAFGTGQRDAEKRRIAGQENRVGACHTFVAADVFDRERGA